MKKQETIRVFFIRSVLLLFSCFVLTSCSKNNDTTVKSIPETDSLALKQLAKPDTAAPETTTPDFMSEIEPTQDTDMEYMGVDMDSVIEQYGLSQEELRSKHRLFQKYAYYVENNDNLSDYRYQVYHIFPVIADHEEYLDEDFFFDGLASLSISMSDEAGNAGLFFPASCEILLYDDSDTVLYHELIHFLDHYISKPETSEECHSDLIVEAGAELVTAKYFTKGVRAYNTISVFLTGMEYIYGSKVFDELFFSGASDQHMLQLFLNAGYSFEEYKTLNQELSFLVYPERNPGMETSVALEDVLIELYEKNKAGDWREDKAFLYILKAYDGIMLDGYRNSKYADDLENIRFRSFEEYDEFERELVTQMGEELSFAMIPPAPFIIDDKLYLGTTAQWTDSTMGETVSGFACLDYDFESDKVKNYELIKTRLP